LAMRAGDSAAFQSLYVTLYGELKRAAKSVRRQMNASATLSTTALVHESYLKMGRVRFADIQDPQHAIRIAACAMREVVIDHLRARLANKRERIEVELEQVEEFYADALAQGAEQSAFDVAKAVEKLEIHQARLAQVVNLKFFAGLNEIEIGELMELDARTVRRDWVKAKAWLADELGWQSGAIS
jgi:RNA polymerase sigma factor (TIGR02999 family)